LSGGVARIVEIADADTLDSRHAQRRFELFTPAPAGADRGNSLDVTGRYRAARGPQRCWL
jgi:hypothetical protein